MKEGLTDSGKTTYNKGKPIRCECNRILAIKDSHGNITIKCRSCKKIVTIFRAESH